MKAICLILILLFLAACGDASADNNTVQLTVAGNDTLSFTPDLMTVSTDSNIALTFKNAGNLDHNFILTNEAVDLLTVSQTDAIAGVQSETLTGGETATLRFVAPEIGRYRYVCVVPGHAASGMVGDLVVEP